MHGSSRAETAAPMVGPTALARLADEPFDVLVVGGGITGAGVALDAASRGLRTALVERDDFASGTSSKSSKLVHGGLRYLQQREFGLVYEALAERQIVARATRRTSCTCSRSSSRSSPATASSTGASRALLGTAMWMYDLTGGLRIRKVHQRIERTRRSRTCRRCARDNVAGGVPLLRRPDRRRPAHAHHRPHRGRARRRRREPRVASPSCARTPTGASPARASWPTATRSRSAPGASSTRPACGPTTCARSTRVRTRARSARPRASTSRCRGRRSATTSPRSSRCRQDRRSVFVVPWGDFTYVGTTDTDYDGPIDDPQCTRRRRRVPAAAR